MTRPTRASRRGDDGAAAVEFAIVSTLLLALMFGILQYGFLFFQVLSAQHAATEAAGLARTAVVTDADGDGNACDEWRGIVRDSTTLIGAQWQRTSWVPTTPPVAGPLQIDDRIEVTVVWEPVRIGGGLIPVPGTGERGTTVMTGLTRLGSEQEYTPPVFGCPDPGAGAPPLPAPVPSPAPSPSP